MKISTKIFAGPAPFCLSHFELKNSLERTKAEMEEAYKAARAEARKRSGSLITKKEPAGNSNKPDAAPGAPAPAKAEPVQVASLFDPAPESHAADTAGTGPSQTVSDLEENEEILPESYAEDEDDRLSEGE
jgi:hypothetical protein